MKQHVKALVAAALAGSAAIWVSAANGSSASSSSSLSVGKSSQTQKSASTTEPIAQNAGEKVSLDKVPEAARTTILQHSGGAKPKDVRMITQNGKQFYTASFDQGRAKGRVTVDRDGSLVSLQQSAIFAADVDLSKLQKSNIGFQQMPMAVQMAIKHQAGTSQVGNLSKSEVNGQPIYRANFDRGGIRHELFITPQGRVAAQVRETTLASQWTFDENGNVVANPGQQINEAAGAQTPQSKQNKQEQSPK